MSPKLNSSGLSFIKLLGWLLTSASLICAQTPQTQKPQEEVVRVFTELVQTDVMVFDKQGRFVNGLTKDNFQLKIDGKPKEIQAFDLVKAGSDEETQLAAARGGNIVTGKTVVPLDRGRTVFFYVDDVHMNLSGLTATRDVISTFIDKDMGQNDQAAIASATGQIGFLQQLTENKEVLHAALKRLTVRNYNVSDHDRPSMSEYQAVLIDRLDRDVLEFFVSETIRQNPALTRDTAAGIVRGRAQAILAQAGSYNMNMLIGLERLIRLVKEVPGRKVVFFLSDGFYLENRRSDSMSKLRDITSAAAKSGVVIYSMDTRGLVASLHDASEPAPFDLTGRLAVSTMGELTASQDGLNALARDTGGRPIFNTNDLKKGIKPALAETSTYYLLAWKPDAESQKQKRFRNIEVNIIGRPDVSVRVRKGFFDVEPTNTSASKPAPTPEDNKTAASKLRESIKAPYPKRDLPVLLGMNFLDIAGKGSILSTSVQLPGEFLSFGPQPDGKIQAILDIAGVYFDEKGQPRASFGERLVTTAVTLEASKDYQNDITYTYPALLPSGLYQVRVAARDDKSGRTGSAHGWIQIPDLTKKQLEASSLLLGERAPDTISNVSSPPSIGPISLSANHRFRRNANLRFLIFAYNTLLASDQKPDVAVQVQLVRDDQPVFTTALRKVGTEGVTDLTRLPYAAEIPLNDLQSGQYILHVTLIDRVAKRSISRETQFEIY
jgi:VWFA-related protein